MVRCFKSFQDVNLLNWFLNYPLKLNNFYQLAICLAKAAAYQLRGQPIRSDSLSVKSIQLIVLLG